MINLNDSLLWCLLSSSAGSLMCFQCFFPPLAKNHISFEGMSSGLGGLQHLRQELLVLKQQLVDEKRVSAELRDELQHAQVAIDALRRHHESYADGAGRPHQQTVNLRERDDLRSRLVHNDVMDDDFDDNDELNDGVALSSHHHQHSPYVPEQLGNVFRASSAMTIRYVPPVDFLPAVFVEQYADVLMIVDRYAQLYHKFHVGGGQRDPQLIVKDEDTQRSERELLESRIRQLEADVTVRDDTIAALKQQLVAWRTTGRDRTKFDPARLDDNITTNATMNRRRNDDGDISSSDHSQVPITAPTRDMPAGDDQNHQRRSSPRRERRRQLQPPQRAVQPIVPQFDAMSPPQVPRREQPTPLVPLDASSPTDRPGRSAPPPNNRTVFGSAPPPPGSQRSLPTSIAQPPPPSANRLNSSNNAVAPDLLGLYAPPRQLFGVDPWKQPQQPTSDVIGPGGIPLPDVKDQYVPSSSSLRHPWGDLMQYT